MINYLRDTITTAQNLNPGVMYILSLMTSTFLEPIWKTQVETLIIENCKANE